MRALFIALCSVCVSGMCASAAIAGTAVRGHGTAKPSEVAKNATVVDVRARALVRARIAALETALDALANSGNAVDPAARRATLKSLDAWTGSYRIIDERVSPDAVEVEIEVDIDVAALAKRVTPRAPDLAPATYLLGPIRGPRSDQLCGGTARFVRDELVAVGAVRDRGDGDPLTFAIECASLGTVRHTFMVTTRVKLSARAGQDTVASVQRDGFATDADSAALSALAAAVADLGAELSVRRSGRLLVRVEAAFPASRVRRLQQALEDAVPGVRQALLVGVEPDGAVRLQLSGSIDAERLASELPTLSLPGFSATIVAVEAADALTLRLQ